MFTLHYCQRGGNWKRLIKNDFQRSGKTRLSRDSKANVPFHSVVFFLLFFFILFGQTCTWIKWKIRVAYFQPRNGQKRSWYSYITVTYLHITASVPAASLYWTPRYVSTWWQRNKYWTRQSTSSGRSSRYGRKPNSIFIHPTGGEHTRIFHETVKIRHDRGNWILFQLVSFAFTYTTTVSSEREEPGSIFP